MTVKFNNYSMWTELKYGSNWYEWCVFVDENSDIINSIKSIEYTLHSTFPDPARLIEDKSTKFALFSSGWGEFSIKTHINYENGASATTTYDLRLENDNWPRKQAPKNFADNKTKLVYQSLSHEKYRWRKIDTIVRNSNLPKDTVLDILGDLKEEDLVRKAHFLSIDSKEMWAATAVVGVSPKINLL